MSQEPGTSTPSSIDLVSLEWIDTRIKEATQSIEKRLSEDREFITGVLGLAAKICGISLVLVIGVFGFFGYKDIASIDDRINKNVSDKIKEKADTFSTIFEKDFQSLTDEALITSYTIQFAAPVKRFQRRPTILPTHLQRFIQILTNENSESKITDPLYDLLSDTSHDGNSAVLNKELLEMVSGSGPFGWIKKNPEKLSKAIDLLTSRSDKTNPDLISKYLLEEGTAPAVRDSAIMYAEMVQDKSVLPILNKMLADEGRNPKLDVLFAVSSLDPTNKTVMEWLKQLETKPNNSA
ncbi:MAG: hypothetical protein JOY94_13865, partial [Methylobacteriaceae bacterium]|nr:hypothetical protein [Methylobacteriaceae bacterium]